MNASESIDQRDTTMTYTFNTRPNSDVTMHFWYYTGTSNALVQHEKVVPVRTTLADVTALNFLVNCSTF